MFSCLAFFATTKKRFAKQATAHGGGFSKGRLFGKPISIQFKHSDASRIELAYQQFKDESPNTTHRYPSPLGMGTYFWLCQESSQMTSITKEITQTVRASVNERQFFRNMGQAYASNFSFVGEVMQNARRAGASSVQFEANFAKRRLEIIDDGCGIEDFQNLIALATSGWESEEVQLSEKPFGMGLFSLFYACDCVTIRSRGQIIKLSLDDIVSKREVHVTQDTDPVLKGTRIVLDHLKDGLMNTNRWVDGFRLTKEGEPSWSLYEAVIFRAASFDIPVVLNGSLIPQPDARRNIKGQMTAIGFVCLAGIHTEVGCIDISASETKYFLQGLPIATRCSSRAKNIVHLDSERFVPLMPDRAQLQDHDTQIAAVNSVVKGILLEHIVGMKASMESAVFVREYFQLATRNGWSYLLNDIAYLPQSLFSRVVCVSIGGGDIFEYVRDLEECISRQAIATGSVRAWRDSAMCTTDGPWTATLLKVMQRGEIFEVDTSALDEKHWIFDCAPSINDFKVSTIAHGVQGSISMDVQWDSCELTLVDSVTVNIASKLNPDFKLVHELTKDWLVVPANQCELVCRDYGHFTGETICYFTTGDAAGLKGFIRTARENRYG